MLPSTSPLTYFHGEEEDAIFSFPHAKDISTFLLEFMTRVPLNRECAITLLVYVDRLLDKGVKLAPFNWKPILIAALLVGSKMWDDSPHWTADFIRIAPQFSIESINRLESAFCEFLEFAFHIDAADYV